MKVKIFATLLALFSLSEHFGQQLTQSIRGRIIDGDAEIPLIGATVVIIDSTKMVGVISDIDGYFKLEDVPLGRVTLQINYIGYEQKTIPNIVVNSAKEVFLNIKLIENVKALAAFEIVGNADHKAPINEMAIISSRKFSTEDAKRYAGSFNDPARMVANYAGVGGNAEGDNDIVVRGNSPKGILWRIEGIEAPNPNHFADEGATGGPINALNSKMLANSEFLTGAFAPEYGNATSGVFDLSLRQGNNEQREYSFGFGVLGTDFTLEGPFKKGGKSSYLANYRYSSLGILDDAGIVDFGGVPKYQDATFNFYLPTNKFGIFKLFGVGGISHIIDTETDSLDENKIMERDDYGANMAFVGLTNTYLINDKTYLKSSLSFSNNGSKNVSEERLDDDILAITDEGALNKYTAKFATSLNKKLNAKNKVTAGFIHTFQHYTFELKELDDNNLPVTLLDIGESSGYSQLHATWKHRFNEDLTLVSGAHFLHFNLNNTSSFEPRVGLNYKLSNNHIFSAGFGVHSRMESLLFYTANVTDANGLTTQPNRNLTLPKANHFVVGYDYHFAENTHVKTEVYYQQLYDVPIADDVNSNYSLINQSNWFDNIALTSQGKGRNYGVELTLERYFSNNFYYLFTASLYESKYQNLDNQWIRTRFDGNYNSNFLIGREFKVGKEHKNKTLLVSLKASLLGGNRYTPIDLEASIQADEAIRSEEPFSAKGEDVFFMNVSGGYRVNRKKTTHELKFEILNATNNKAKTNEYYDAEDEKLVYSEQLSIIPNVMYVINF